MKSLFIGKLVCDDSFLQASKVLTATNVNDVINAALTFTPFKVAQLYLVNARVGEQYFPDCKKLGYSTSFFRELTVLTYFTLTQGQGNTPTFDGIYIPFSGEIYLLPHDICEFADAQNGCYDAAFSGINAQAVGGEKYYRRFDVLVKDNTASVLASTFKTIKRKIVGEDGKTLTVKPIESMTVTADVLIKTGTNGKPCEKTFDPMYFLYNGVK